MRKFAITVMLFASSVSFSQTAADFTVTDMDGKQYRLYELASEGKYVIIEWLATWSNYCKISVPGLNQYWKTYGCNSGGLIVLGISGWGDDTDNDVIDYIIKNNVRFPVASGASDQGGGAVAGEGYDANTSFPSFSWITPDNQLQKWRGYPGGKELEELLPTFISEAGITEKSCPDDGKVRLWIYQGNGTGRYLPGETITASPLIPEHKLFTHWSGGAGLIADSTATQVSLTMPDTETTIYANLRIETDGILMPSGTGHTVTVTEPTFFYDDGGDFFKYLRSYEGEITFVPGSPGHAIKIEFLQFSVQESNNWGTWDKMFLYDGNSTAAPLLGTHYGTNSPGVLESTAGDGSVTITWISDYGFVGKGWKAQLSLVPSETTAIGKALRAPLPNPVSLLVNLDGQGLSYHAAREGYYAISLFTTRGKLVLRQKLKLNQGLNMVPVPAMGVPGGLLLVRVKYEI